MKKVTDSYIHDHIKNAVLKLVPDQAEYLWKQPVEKAVGDEWYLDGTRTRKGGESKAGSGKVVKYVSSLAACLALCFLTYYMISLRVEATVYLDVNPSVALDVNSRERVLEAKANNEDGQVILGDMDLKNTDLDVAVNAILGSMVRHGYLNQEQNIVLLSVEGSNRKKTEDIRKRLSGEISICIDSLLGTGAVLDQEVEKDQQLDALAEKYGISLGKAALLQKLLADNPGIELETLAQMSIHELSEYLEELDIDLGEYVNYTGKGDYEEPEKEGPEDDGEYDADPADERDEESADHKDDSEDEPEKDSLEDAPEEEDDSESIPEADEQEDGEEAEKEKREEGVEEEKEDREVLEDGCQNREKEDVEDDVSEAKFLKEEDEEKVQERIDRKMANLKHRLELLEKKKEEQEALLEMDDREDKEDKPEAQYDPEAEYEPEAQYDPEAEYEPEAQYDPEAEYEPEAQYDPEAEYEPEVQYDPEPEYEPEYEADEEEEEDDD